jgi:predicted AAA+ superfamily ATPase
LVSGGKHANLIAAAKRTTKKPNTTAENFVLSELARQLTWSGPSVRLYHYRDRDQYEVDGVLEDNAARSSAWRSRGAKLFARMTSVG